MPAVLLYFKLDMSLLHQSRFSSLNAFLSVHTVLSLEHTVTRLLATDRDQTVLIAQSVCVLQ